MPMRSLDVRTLGAFVHALPLPAWVEGPDGRVIARNAATSLVAGLDTSSHHGACGGRGTFRVPVRMGEEGSVGHLVVDTTAASGTLDLALLRTLLAASAQDLRNIRQVVAMVRDAVHAEDGTTSATPLALSALERTLEWGQDLVCALRVLTPAVRRSSTADAMRVFRTASTFGDVLTRGGPRTRIEVAREPAWIAADERHLVRTFLHFVLAARTSAARSGATELRIAARGIEGRRIVFEVRHDGTVPADDPLVAYVDALRRGPGGKGVRAAVSTGKGSRGAGFSLSLVLPEAAVLQAASFVGRTMMGVGLADAGPSLSGLAAASGFRWVDRGDALATAEPPAVMVWNAGTTTHDPSQVAATAARWIVGHGTTCLVLAGDGSSALAEVRMLEHLGAVVFHRFDDLVEHLRGLGTCGVDPCADGADVPAFRIHEAS
ncbi:MAG: hypothetical protein D6705_15705 [Deltaproteobacteria bacterium]|nr:MAG: hypothetical protein D6705_15705 [Deltaproteobacteria bacterium]